MDSDSESLNRQTVDSTYHSLIGYDVLDVSGEKVGQVDHVYVEEAGQPLFLGVKTGWLFGKNHVVPTSQAEVNEPRRVVRLPYTGEQIKNAPHFDETIDITDADHDQIFNYYGGSAPRAENVGTSIPQSEDIAESRTIELKEEELKVGKRQVEAGGIRLRKIVRTETVNQPIELQREEIVIERVPGNQARATENFSEEDIFIPLRREEAVVQKEARVREEVRVGKRTEVDAQTVTEQVRKEDLEIEKDASRRPPL